MSMMQYTDNIFIKAISLIARVVGADAYSVSSNPLLTASKFSKILLYASLGHSISFFVLVDHGPKQIPTTNRPR